ncbi:MAG: DUF1614 domain-containing protein [Candidatus Nezhaarchaeales archaeon]|nr:MAG: hypothetical protein DSO06_02160 [Candidatus Nezhaarchaeota archaeon WYZ-LMO8]TDA36853.1 MAG: hypothetical protein DSO05_02215 [Candidatus Nezhaarchaeota archaeon WYZ-LMO7]
MGKKIIVQVPLHPIFLLSFLFLAFAPLIWLLFTPSALAYAFQPLGLNHSIGYVVALVMVLLSLTLSFVNIAIVEIPHQILIPDVEYISFFGIYYPVPRLRLVTSKTLVAINVGGAIVPLTISLLMIFLMSTTTKALQALFVETLVILLVSLVSYSSSRIVPGLGIVAPAFIPPLTAALSTIILSSFMGLVELAPAIAYSGAVIGVLIGADVVNLIKHFDELRSPLISIGGAGTFDGIYLSGIMALFLTLLFA